MVQTWMGASPKQVTHVLAISQPTRELSPARVRMTQMPGQVTHAGVPLGTAGIQLQTAARTPMSVYRPVAAGPIPAVLNDEMRGKH
jgi:hypothetical protein